MHGGRILTQEAHEESQDTEFPGPLLLDGILPIGQLPGVQREVDDEFAAVESHYHPVGKVNDNGEDSHDNEPDLDAVFPDPGPVALDGGADYHIEERDAEEEAEQFVHQDEDGRILLQIQRMGPTVFPVFAKANALADVVIGVHIH